MDLVESFRGYTRIAIAGGPRTGKSTLAVRAGERFGIPVRHADSLVGQPGIDWHEHSRLVSLWFDDPGPAIIEGVSVPRALRKWLAANQWKVLDWVVIWMPKPVQYQSQRQLGMARGVRTVFGEILPALKGAGVQVLERV